MTTTTPSETLTNGTIQASRIPRSTSSTLHDRKQTPSTNGHRNDETISPVTRKSRGGTTGTFYFHDTRGFNLHLDLFCPPRSRRLASRSLLPFPPPPSSSSSSSSSSSTVISNSVSKRQDTYLILSPKDDKSDRRVVLIPRPPQPPIRVGRVVNPKSPAKFDNLLFDTKVLSRNHAECFSDIQGRVFIRDLGSSNGTYINGYRLSPDTVSSEPFQLIVGQELVVPLPPPPPFFFPALFSELGG